ncbi:MAG TPA: LysE family transporter [Ktedonobacterales bacterium]|jgi:threonine/homoserine/homoserine lactone efflux protein
MLWVNVLRGVLLGLSIAAPVGPIGVLCIRRTLAYGRIVGFVSGLGAATADAFYGSVAAFGLTAISALLIAQSLWLRLIGGAFLLYLGVRTLLARPAEAPPPPVAPASLPGRPLPSPVAPASPVPFCLRVPGRPPLRGLISAYGSTLFLTLTNPLTILSFAAIFAGLGVASASGAYSAAGLLVLGVFLGSGLWWLFLSSVVGVFRARMGPRQLRWVNWLSGGIIVVFGVLALLSARG